MNNLNQTDIMIQILLKAAGVVEELKRQTTALNKLTEAADKAKAAVAGVGGTEKTATQLNNTATSAQKVATNVEKIEPAANKAGKGLWSLRNVARTALGTLEAMAIFLITRFIGQAITKSIESIKQLELSLWKLQAAEKSLSEAGVGITPKDLLSIADELQKQFSFISDIDAKKAASNMALLTKDLKLTKEQMTELTKIAALWSFEFGIAMDAAVTEVGNALVTNGRGLKDRGIQVDAAVIRENAVNAGLVANAEAYDNLTAEQKQNIDVLSLMDIMQKNVKASMEDMNNPLIAVTMATGELNAAWENFTTKAGTVFRPALLALLKGLTLYLEVWQNGFTMLQIVIAGFVASLDAMFLTIDDILAGRIKSSEDFAKAFSKNMETATKAAFTTAFPGGVPDLTVGGTTIAGTSILNKYIENMKDTKTGLSETTTDVIKELGASAEDIAKAIDDAKKTIDDALADLEFDRVEAKIDLDIKLEDIGIKLGQQLEDAERNYKEKIVDINQKYSEKVSDINRDSSEKRQDAIRKAHEDEVNEERDFQNKLLALKEDFLMDLDDALHARDARQVLRLIRQYNLDKARLIRERADKKAENAAELAQNLSDINQDRERRLADAARERKQDLANAKKDYAEKRAELKLNAERERADAKRDYDRKLADLQRHFNEKMDALLRSIVQEGKLNAAGAKMVYDALNAYRPGGAIWNTWANYLKYVQAIQAAVAGSVPGTINRQDDYALRHPGTAGSYKPVTQNPFPYHPGGYAEGGTLLANRPTTVTFGEGGLEMARFTPIGRRGRDTNKIFSNLGGGAGMGGNLKLQVVMSEGLVAEIIDTSLKNVTSVIETVRRERR